MIKNVRITIAFYLFSGVIIAISNIIEKNDFNLIKLLGSALILFAVPLLVTYSIQGINILFKQPFKEKSFISTYITGWVLFSAYNFIAVSTDLGWPPIP